MSPSAIGPGAAGQVAGRGLDLEDVGSEIGQQHRGVRAGEGVGEIDDADAGERATAHSAAAWSRIGRKCFLNTSGFSDIEKWPTPSMWV